MLQMVEIIYQFMIISARNGRVSRRNEPLASPSIRNFVHLNLLRKSVRKLLRKSFRLYNCYFEASVFV